MCVAANETGEAFFFWWGGKVCEPHGRRREERQEEAVKIHSNYVSGSKSIHMSDLSVPGPIIIRSFYHIAMCDTTWLSHKVQIVPLERGGS